MTIRFLAKGTRYEPLAEYTWEAIAAVLAILIVVKMGFRWAGKTEQHSRQVGENISLATQADHLLGKKPPPGEDASYGFFLLADSVEKADRDLLGIPKDKAKHCAYREALKEFGADVKRPICHQSRGSTFQVRVRPAAIHSPKRKGASEWLRRSSSSKTGLIRCLASC